MARGSVKAGLIGVARAVALVVMNIILAVAFLCGLVAWPLPTIGTAVGWLVFEALRDVYRDARWKV